MSKENCLGKEKKVSREQEYGKEAVLLEKN